MSISHLFYADDAMFIGEWSDSNLKNIVKILKCFFLASGLKINIHKSQVLGVGVPRNLVTQAASMIGCAVMQKPFRYLGVKVGDCMSWKTAWVDTVHKLRSRLSNWKVKTLYIRVPKGVLKEMEAIRSKFFNRADISDRKITWAAWDKVLASKKNRGLAVSSFHAFPRLFTLETDKEATVAAKLGAFLFLRFLFVGSLCAWMEMSRHIGLGLSFFVRVSLSSSKDRWICDLTGDGDFRVKDVHNSLDDLFLPSHPDATRWRRYFGSALCPPCDSTVEDIHHILFRCDNAQIVFRRICRWWELDWYDLASFSDWYAWFSAIRFSSSLKLLLEGVF
ncbi:RNA-directed DNA polymerase, eukaryota [Tanacetum coccineum]